MRRITSPALRVASAAAGPLLAMALVAGCSADTDTQAGASVSPSPTSSVSESPTADVCADVDAAQASLQALVDTDILREGTDTVKTRLATLKSDLQVLVESGRAEVAPESAAVKESIATLESVLAGLKEDPTAADLASVKPALESVATSAQDLVTALESTC